jgi:hypothetical protein
MNQTRVHCIHIWKYHNKTPRQLLYTNKNVNFFNFKSKKIEWINHSWCVHHETLTLQDPHGDGVTIK